MNEVKNKKIGIVISGMDTTENVSFYQGICDEAKKFGLGGLGVLKYENNILTGSLVKFLNKVIWGFFRR